MNLKRSFFIPFIEHSKITLKFRNKFSSKTNKQNTFPITFSEKTRKFQNKFFNDSQDWWNIVFTSTEKTSFCLSGENSKLMSWGFQLVNFNNSQSLYFYCLLLLHQRDSHSCLSRWKIILQIFLEVFHFWFFD